MLNHLKLKNFKAFEEIELEIKPLTFFLGPNNSGKSAILAAIRMLVQTIQSHDGKIPLLLNGHLGEFGTYQDIVYGNNPKEEMDIGFGLTWGQTYSPDLIVTLSYKYDKPNRKIILQRSTLNYVGEKSFSIVDLEGRYQVDKIDDKIISPFDATDIGVYRFLPDFGDFIEQLLKKEELSSFLKKENSFDPRHYVFHTTDQVASYFYQDIDYIGPLRNPPARTYLFSGEEREWIGIMGENAINILTMQNKQHEMDLSHLISQWLKKAGIASHFRVNILTDRHYEIQVQHPATKEYQNLADVGYGNSQVIPVLIGGYNLGPRSTYLVEQPEIHLHPRAQAELGDFFLDLYENKVQSLVETHSEHLILRLQQHVANKKILPEDIQIYYIYAEGERKIAAPLRLDEQGRFIDKWPGGFFPERLAETKKLAQLRYSHRAAA